MSQRAPDRPRRECSECGAPLSFWCCEVCGGDTLDTVSRTYIAELASPWRARKAARRPVAPAQEPLPLAA
jgi:predicted amidophosphoribosyltransferase